MRGAAVRSLSQQCKPTRDFLRHIVNPHVAEALLAIESGKVLDLRNEENKRFASKLMSLLNDFKKSLSRAESKNDFSIFGGNPALLASLLSSGSWSELVNILYTETKNNPTAWNFVKGVLTSILQDLVTYYKDSCPDVATAAEKRLADLQSLRAAEGRSEGAGAEKPAQSA